MSAATGPAIRGRARDLARAAAGPLICAAAVTGLLAAWVSSGGAGTISRVQIQVTLAAIPMRSFTGRAAGSPGAGAYLTIRNLSAAPDVLTGASSPAARRVILTRRAGGGAAGSAGSRPVTGGLAIPAHSVVTLSPFGDDVVLTGSPQLTAGQHVPLTLTFRDAGRVTVEAAVTAPGTP